MEWNVRNIKDKISFKKAADDGTPSDEMTADDSKMSDEMAADNEPTSDR